MGGAMGTTTSRLEQPHKQERQLIFSCGPFLFRFQHISFVLIFVKSDWMLPAFQNRLPSLGVNGFEESTHS
ncbi:transmembrane protein, putative [Medicago truncatula]|uniref:Transmembrane protein, putative n=1 Tax=Medicago truncatula TaxID=3880 RepID=A0A072ULG6_MEDTR|nr:transmembrane protein, putative [Medicago truncatula]